MKKIVIFFVLALVVAFGVITGCQSVSPTATTPAPTQVTFSITNNTTTGHPVNDVMLTRNSNGVVYNAPCNVPVGSTINVSVTIPANDTYNVEVSYPYMGNDWNAVSMTLGNTYTVVITTHASTLDSQVCSVCLM